MKKRGINIVDEAGCGVLLVLFAIIAFVIIYLSNEFK